MKTGLINMLCIAGCMVTGAVLAQPAEPSSYARMSCAELTAEGVKLDETIKTNESTKSISDFGSMFLNTLAAVNPRVGQSSSAMNSLNDFNKTHTNETESLDFYRKQKVFLQRYAASKNCPAIF